MIHALMSVGMVAGTAGMLAYPVSAGWAVAFAYLAAAAFAFASALGG